MGTTYHQEGSIVTSARETKMAQRPITAFFSRPKSNSDVVPTAAKKSETKPVDEETDDTASKETKTEASPVTSILKIVKKESSIQKLAPEDSPIKKTSRKRAVILDSDEGSQDSENEKLKRQLSGSEGSDDEGAKIVVKLSTPVAKKKTAKKNKLFLT